jgi:hypothetical protein
VLRRRSHWWTRTTSNGQCAVLASVLQALRSGTEHSEADMAASTRFSKHQWRRRLAQRGAAVAFENLKRARSNVLVQVATNLLLIQIQDQ